MKIVFYLTTFFIFLSSGAFAESFNPRPGLYDIVKQPSIGQVPNRYYIARIEARISYNRYFYDLHTFPTEDFSQVVYSRSRPLFNPDQWTRCEQSLNYAKCIKNIWVTETTIKDLGNGNIQVTIIEETIGSPSQHKEEVWVLRPKQRSVETIPRKNVYRCKSQSRNNYSLALQPDLNKAWLLKSINESSGLSLGLDHVIKSYSCLHCYSFIVEYLGLMTPSRMQSTGTSGPITVFFGPSPLNCFYTP